MNRRQFINLVLGGALLVGASAFGLDLLNSKKLKPLVKIVEERDKALEIIENKQYYIDKFLTFSKSKQDKILKHIDNFFLTKTELGKITSEVLKLTLEEKINTEQSQGLYEYDSYNNCMVYNPPSNKKRIEHYLTGEPMQTAKTHEILHSIHDMASKWNKFEDYIKDFVPEGNPGKQKIRISKKKAKDFAIQFMKKPSASYQESVKEFIKMLDEYAKSRPYRIIVMESQAHLAFEPYTKSKNLYDRLDRSVQKKLINLISRSDFSKLFHSTIESLGMDHPIIGARFLAENTDSQNPIEQYINAVNKLKQQKNMPDAYQKGIQRQKRLLKDEGNIIKETARCIEEF